LGRDDVEVKTQGTPHQLVESSVSFGLRDFAGMEECVELAADDVLEALPVRVLAMDCVVDVGQVCAWQIGILLGSRCPLSPSPICLYYTNC
jgi:hypothetical protein